MTEQPPPQDPPPQGSSEPQDPGQPGRWMMNPSGEWQWVPNAPEQLPPQGPQGPQGPPPQGPPPQGPTSQGPPPQGPHGPPPQQPHWWRRHPYWTLAIAFVLIAAAATGGGVAGTSGSNQTASGSTSGGIPSQLPSPSATDTSNFPSDVPSPSYSYSYSPSPSASPSTSLAVKNLGETMNIVSTDGGNLDVDVTVHSVQIETTAGGEYNEPPTKGEFAVADVSIKVNSGSYDYSEDNFNFQEPDGTTYSTDDGNGLDSGYDPSLDLGTLPAGGTKRGNVVFDVSTVHGGQVTLNDEYAGTELGYWKVP